MNFLSSIGDLFRQLPEKLGHIGKNAGIAIKENPRIIGDVIHGDYSSLGRGIHQVGEAQRNSAQAIDQMSQDNSPVPQYTPEQAGVSAQVQEPLVAPDMGADEWLRRQRR